MADYILRVYTDVLTEKATLSSALPGGNRGLYLADGMATVRDERGGATLSANSAWFSTGNTTITAGANGARVLRYELVKGGTPDADGLAQGDGVTSICVDPHSSVTTVTHPPVPNPPGSPGVSDRGSSHVV